MQDADVVLVAAGRRSEGSDETCRRRRQLKAMKARKSGMFPPYSWVLLVARSLCNGRKLAEMEPGPRAMTGSTAWCRRGFGDWVVGLGFRAFLAS